MFDNQTQLIQFIVGTVLIVIFAWILSWWLLLIVPVLAAYRVWYFRLRRHS